MKNTSGFTHWVIVILISVMAVGLVGATWWYEVNKEEATTSTGTTSETNTNTAISSNANTNTAVNGNTNTVMNTNTVINDTDDWLTYENEEYGFSFRYPSRLGNTVGEYIPYPNVVFNGKTVKVFGISAASANQFIQVYIIEDSLKNVKDDIESREFDYYDKVAEWEATKLSDVPAEYVKKSYNLANDYFQNIYVFEKNDLIYVVYTFNQLGESDTAISTFKIK